MKHYNLKINSKLFLNLYLQNFTNFLKKRKQLINNGGHTRTIPELWDLKIRQVKHLLLHLAPFSTHSRHRHLPPHRNLLLPLHPLERYGMPPEAEAAATAKLIEEEAFASASISIASSDDGIEIFQGYSKEISKWMLETRGRPRNFFSAWVGVNFFTANKYIN